MSEYDDAFLKASGAGKNVKNEYDGIAENLLKKALQPAMDYDKSQQTDVRFDGNLRFATPFGTIDTRIPLPESVNRKLASFGSGIADIGAAFDSPADVAEKRRLDEKLNDSGAGKAAKFMGKVLPAMAIPQIGGPVLGGMAIGGAMGAMEPVGPGESRLSNVLTSTALGGVIPGVIGVTKWLAKPDAARSALSQSAIDQGIPLGVSDVTSNRLIKGARSVLDDMPFIGSIGEKANNAKQAGFNRAVGRSFGSDATSLTPKVMADAKTRIGGELNKVWDNNPLQIDRQFVNDLARIQTKAAEKLNPEQAAMVQRHIDNLLAKESNGAIDGGFTNNWQSELRMASDGEKGLAQNILSDLRKSTLSAFNRNVSSADAAALTKARTQYGAFKTVEPLMNSAEAGVAGRTIGDVPAALLPQKVMQQYGSAGRSPFGDLPQIGSQFVANRTPMTGGSPRALIQNMGIGSALTGGIGAAAGGLLGGTGAGFGGAALGVGGGALIEKLLSSPDIAQSVLTPALRRSLLSSPEMKPMLVELLKNSVNRAPVAAGMGLLSAPALE